MGKRIFFISSGVLQAYHYDGRLGEPISFRADEQGLTRFSQYLEQPWKDPVYVLVDFVEEEFREEQIPHVMGADRQSLIRTRLTRLFRDATYSHAQFHGRSSEGRRDDRMLFAALIRPDLLAPWMGQLTKQRIAVAGIYSLPLISKQLLKLLKLDARCLLLVTLQSSGGLRQTYFQDGELKVSRLATLPDTSAERFTSSMLGEVERVRRYLNSLRMLPTGEALEVYVLGTERVREEVQRHSPTSITAHHRVIPLAEVARKVGITGAFNDRFSDRIFAQLLARRPPANQYAPALQTRYFKLHKLRRGLIAASVFLFMGGLAWSAATFVDGLGAIQDLAGAREQATFYRLRYENARARLPGTPTDPRNMKRVIEAVDALATFRTTPVPLLQVLSIGLDRFPQVQLHELRWRTSSDPGAQVDNVEALPVKPQRAGEPVPEALELYQVAKFKARITAFDGDYRAALAMVRSFADRLRTIPGVEAVQVESMPLDIGPDASLKGDARANADVAAPDAEFELRVAVRSGGGSA